MPRSREKGKRRQEARPEEAQEQAHAALHAHPHQLFPCPPSRWPVRHVEAHHHVRTGAGQAASRHWAPCCIYQAQEHLYSPPLLRAANATDEATGEATDEANRSAALLRWRACQHLCSAAGALSDSLAPQATTTLVTEEGDADTPDAPAPVPGAPAPSESQRVSMPEDVEWVAPGETLDALSDALTEGVSGSFVRWLPADVAAAVLQHHPCPLHAHRHLPDACASGGHAEAVALELHEALQQDESEMEGAVVMRGLAGAEGGWNCSCRDTRRGWADVEKRRECCGRRGQTGFRVSQGQQLARLLANASRPGLWRSVYSAEAVERTAVSDLDRLARFLSMLRQRRPVLLITSADVPADVAALVVGPDSQVLTAPRDEVLLPATLHRLEHAALAALASTPASADGGRVRAVVLAIGSTAGIILQKRLCQRLFSPKHVNAEKGAGAVKRRVLMMDMSPVVELLAGVSPDLVAVGRGYTLGVWERASGTDGAMLRRRLMRAAEVAGQLKVLVATALVDKEEDVWNRTALYQDTFRTLARLGYPLPLIAEAVLAPQNAHSMLDRYGQVVYTAVNDQRYMANQGVNEARSLLVALARFGLPGNTMVIKLTGRYTFVDRSMFQLLEDNMEALDGLVSVAAHKGLMFTGCFALRASLLVHALEASDWNAVSHRGIHLEFLVLEHARKLCQAKPRGHACRLLQVGRLGVAARRSDSALAVVW